MQDEIDEDVLAPPPPRKRKSEPEVTGLQRKAEAIVRLHAITFNTFNGKRVIHCDDPLPAKEYETLAEAMRKGLI